jgi:hypothetical protein
MRKHICSIGICLLLLSAAGFSQSTTPRYGTSANQDNTGRILTYKYVSLTDAAGADSVIARPREYSTLYRVVLVDSFTFKQPVITSCYAGDYITIVASAASGTPKMKFTGSNWITAGTATLSTGLRAVIRLVFDGAKWVEVSRVVQ